MSLRCAVLHSLVTLATMPNSQEDGLGLATPAGVSDDTEPPSQFTPDELRAMGVGVHGGEPEEKDEKDEKVDDGKAEDAATEEPEPVPAAAVLNGKQAVLAASQNPEGMVHKDDYYVLVPGAQ